MRIRFVARSGSTDDIKCVRAVLDERLKGGRDILSSPDFRTCDDIEAERAGGCLNLAYLQHDQGIADIAQDCQSAETGDDLAQKLDPLARKISRQE